MELLVLMFNLNKKIVLCSKIHSYMKHVGHHALGNGVLLFCWKERMLYQQPDCRFSSRKRAARLYRLTCAWRRALGRAHRSRVSQRQHLQGLALIPKHLLWISSIKCKVLETFRSRDRLKFILLFSSATDHHTEGHSGPLWSFKNRNKMAPSTYF